METQIIVVVYYTLYNRDLDPMYPALTFTSIITFTLAAS